MDDRVFKREVLNLAKCPHCAVASPLLERKHQLQFAGQVDLRSRHWALYFCRSCGNPVVAGGPGDDPKVVIRVIPQPEAVHADIPKRPREYLQQALDTQHAPSASILVAGSAVDAMLKEKGLEEGSLYSRIEKAAADHLITDEMSAWAHEVRLDANDERQDDEWRMAPTPRDAKRSVEFAQALAEYLFVLPSKVARGRRAASEEGTGST